MRYRFWAFIYRAIDRLSEWSWKRRTAWVTPESLRMLEENFRFERYLGREG